MGWLAPVGVAVIDLGRGFAVTPKPAPVLRYLETALPKQLEMMRSAARKKAAVCGRRSGKTYGADLGLIDKGLAIPGVVCPYVCLSKTSARYITWPVLHEIEREHHIGLDFDDQKLIAKLPNGSEIPLWGADEKRDMEKLRGGKYGRVVVDEAGSFPRDLLGYLLDEVLEPATADYLGDIWLIGSPNEAAVGYFFDATTGGGNDVAGWPTWHWTILDNTHLPHGRAELERIMAEHGWTYESPVVRREWLGEWLRDASKLVYRFDPKRHIRPAPDDIAWYSLAVDLGASLVKPTTAFVLLGYPAIGSTVWVCEAEKVIAPGPDDVADRIQGYMERLGSKLHTIVCDPGGLGAGYVSHFVERRRLPVEPAEKKDKAGHIEHLNGDFDGNRLLIDPQARALLDEIEILPWDDKRLDSKEGCPDHCCDGMLYGWRACRAYAQPEHEQQRVERAADPAAWMQQFEARMRAKRARELDGKPRAWGKGKVI